MVRWNYLGYSRHGGVLRYRRRPKWLTTIGRGDFHDGYAVRASRRGAPSARATGAFLLPFLTCQIAEIGYPIRLFLSSV